MKVDEQLRNQKLNSIYSKDKELYKRIANDTEIDLGTLDDIDKALGKQLQNDSPKKITLNTNGIKNDFCEALKIRYNSTQVEEDEVVGEVIIAGVTFNVDIEVRRAIVALLEIGITPDQKLSIAVNKLFEATLQTLIKSSYTTKNTFVKAISLVEGEYEKLLVKAIKDIFNA